MRESLENKESQGSKRLIDCFHVLVVLGVLHHRRRTTNIPPSNVPERGPGQDRHPSTPKKGGSDQPGPRGWSRRFLDTNTVCPDFPNAGQEGLT